MKAKHIVRTLTLLVALGTVTFFVARPGAQTTEDAWKAWVDEQTETVLRSAGEMDEARRTEMRASIRAKFSALAAALKNEVASPPLTEDYVTLQTVKELRDAYDEDYNRRHQTTTVRVTYKAGDSEIFAYDENILLAEVDAKYPRDAWLQRLLDRGVTIENADAYWEYLFLRDTLMHVEQPQVWTSGLFGIPPTKEWETYKTAYIERELSRIQKRLEKERHKQTSHRFLEGLHSLHPHNWEQHLKVPHVLIPELPKVTSFTVHKHYSGPQTVKALRAAYDEKYNERYAMTSGSVIYKLNSVTILEYQTPLPISEVEAKYPRDEWLQMLLEKGITIDNFEEYWAYLSQRETLVQIEKHPEVWSSGLFSILPTDDWETYKVAYLKQNIEKLRGERYGVEIGEDIHKAETDAREIERRIRERLQRPLLDR